jgi:hypothetical protein
LLVKGVRGPRIDGRARDVAMMELRTEARSLKLAMRGKASEAMRIKSA